MAADQESVIYSLAKNGPRVWGKEGKFRSLGEGGGQSEIWQFRDSLSVALIIISLRERETLIRMAYLPTIFCWGGEGNSFRFKVEV